MSGLLAQAGYFTALVGKLHLQPLATRPGMESLECQPIMRDLGFWRTRRQEWLKYLDEIRNDLRLGRPYSACPYCEGTGKKCTVCKGVGWVGKSSHHACPKDLIAKIKDTIRE